MTATAPATAELARARGLAHRSQLPWVDLDAETIDPSAVARLPFELMARYLAVPIGFSQRQICNSAPHQWPVRLQRPAQLECHLYLGRRSPTLVNSTSAPTAT